MDPGNWSQVTEFIILGFPHLQGVQAYLFVLLLLIYLTTVVGNLLIFLVVRLDSRLHTPMYHFLSALSLLELGYTGVTIPKMLSNLLSVEKTISFSGCLLQIYFFHSLGAAECYLLTAMAYDRYLAICRPLHYPTLMTPELCAKIAGFLMLLPETVWISTLPFCGSNQIHQLFCDFEPVLRLACADTSVILVVVDIVHAVEIIIAVMLIFMSYIGIVTVILRIRSADGRRKAFATCVSHLTVFLVFFGSVALMYLRFSATYSLFWDTVIALAFAVLSPFFNPIIYSLRNKEIKEAIKKHWGQAKLFFHKTKDLK
ncbi:unnamed protein product [Gulo gulo]|uniref:Olfactory receptor n=1 Tax=Gulo gulo TaxID=48420 RepID=A0A9X9MCN6_GULGU|nr:unnamed protein product [Gulo gulo]